MSFWRRFLDYRFQSPPKRRVKREAYAGAAYNRLTGGFLGSGLQSPTRELQNELTTLRTRSRDLCRNSPLMARYLGLVAENVGGKDGITLQPRAVMRDGSPDEKANLKIKDAWWRWGRAVNCTVDRSSTFAGFLRRVEALRAQDGEAFVRIHEAFDNPFGFALQLIDPDLVDYQYTETGADGRPTVVMGVEVDRWGAPVAYHVLTRHPSETGNVQRERVRVPATEMFHRFRKLRPGQMRGVPDVAPVMLATESLDGFNYAALTEARTAASKQGFIKQSPDADADDPDAPTVTRTTEASPGAIDVLAPGEDFVGWDPKSPSGNFGPFVTKHEKMIATGLGVSYMGLTGDLSENSFASSRTGLLAERDAWRIRQCELAEQVCDPIYRRWLRSATLTGQLKLESDDMSRYEAVEWRGRSWAWVDPEKDVTSAALAIAYGLATPQDILAENGKEIEDVYEGIAAANALAESLDIDIATPSGATMPPDPSTEPAPGADTAPADPGAEDRKLMVKAMEGVEGAVKWIAGREQPAPVINVTTPPVDVRIGGPKKGSEFVVQRDKDGLILGATFQEPTDVVEA